MYAHVGFGSHAVDYMEAWALQRAVHARRALGEIPDSCLLLEHQPVYTAGKRTAVSDRPLGDAGAPVINVDRGGKITWHGPGQLTAYPIVKLREPVDVMAYVRSLEEAMIAVCADFGVRAGRVEGRSGAWIPAAGDLPDRKVGAIGARVARGVTMHGLALNCDNDMSWFDKIVPCGIRDAGVTSLTEQTGIRVSVADVTPLLERHLAAALGYRTWHRMHTLTPLLASPTDRASALAGRAPARDRTTPPPSACASAVHQAARRRTSQTAAAMSSADSASSQPPSIHWNGQNRLPGW